MERSTATKIFLDSSDPKETEGIIAHLGYIDGQTTNPSQIAKTPEAQKRLEEGNKFGTEEVYEFYKGVIGSIRAIMPEGSISAEVYADSTTTADAIITQAKEMYEWTPGAHIKIPIMKEGLRAAEILTGEGMRVNMTLCFSQSQAAAVYAATRGAEKGQVFISSFIGRLDDQGERGITLVENIMKMYERSDGHVEVLTASVQNLDHLIQAFQAKSDIVTATYKVLKEWDGTNTANNTAEENLRPVPYEDISLERAWDEYDITHPLTTKGIQRFADDWNEIIE